MMFIGRVRGYPVAREERASSKRSPASTPRPTRRGELKHGPRSDRPGDADGRDRPDDEMLDEEPHHPGRDPRPQRPHPDGQPTSETDQADDYIIVPRNQNSSTRSCCRSRSQLFAYHAAVALGPRRRQAPQPSPRASPVE